MTTARFRLAARLGGVALVALSCGDPAPLGVSPGAPAAAGHLLGALTEPFGLLACSPLPYDSVTQTIGPEGGTLHVGPHALSVPPGALAAPVSITAVAPPATVNRVDFQPEGLTFAQPALLAMSYANCDLLSSTLPKRIALTTADLALLEYLPSQDDVWSFTVTGRLEHFSTYAVAW
jgi:hypothetical protein